MPNENTATDARAVLSAYLASPYESESGIKGMTMRDALFTGFDEGWLEDAMPQEVDDAMEDDDPVAYFQSLAETFNGLARNIRRALDESGVTKRPHRSSSDVMQRIADIQERHREA